MNPVLVVTSLSLQRLDNSQLAAANNALNGFGKIHPQNLAYDKMKELSLIKDDGTAYDKDILLSALSFEVNSRVKAGTFS